jgi:hypothetical protein
MPENKPPSGKGNFLTEAVEDLLEGIGDVFEGKIFDFGEETKEVKTDGNGSGSGGSVPAVPAGKTKPAGKPKPGKSAAEQLSDTFSTSEETGEATGVATETATESGTGTKPGTGGK